MGKGRHRKIYESFVFGKRICSISREAEMFFWRVYVVADDFGNFELDPDTLVAKAGGLRKLSAIEIQGWIKEMETAGLVQLYQAGKKWFGHFLSFSEFQGPTGPAHAPQFGMQRHCPESPWDIIPEAVTRPMLEGVLTRGQLKQALKTLKESLPCQDCGKTYPSHQMDFDHRPDETKLFNLSDANDKPVDMVKAEVRKCDLVCALCHRERTQFRVSKGGGPGVPPSNDDFNPKEKEKKESDIKKEKKENTYLFRNEEQEKNKNVDSISQGALFQSNNGKFPGELMTTSPAKHDFIVKIFKYWQKVCNHPQAQLSPERVRKLELRWKDSTEEELKQAIDGCASSDFHMGRQLNNPVRYDDIMLICRDRTKVEFFMEKVKTSKKPSALDQKKKRSEEAKKRYHGNNGKDA